MLEEIANKHWDVIVIGSGMGGGSVAYQLASQGCSVLILEKGIATQELVDRGKASKSNARQFRIAGGWWPARLTTVVDGRQVDTFAPIGCGVGGSTAHYAGALERFSESDFCNSGRYELPDNSSGVEHWPLEYSDFVPFYEEAERLLRVYGGEHAVKFGDDNSSVEGLNEVDLHFIESFKALGLKPYRQPLAGNKYPGDLSPRSRVGSKEAFVEPAVSDFGAALLTNCEVLCIRADAKAVTAVDCLVEDVRLTLTAKQYVLSAGALFSPVLLLKSRSASWPNGLGNSYDLVGRNLMFHVGNQFALWPRKKLKDNTKTGKTVALRDHYIHQGKKLGSVQSMGLQAGRTQILHVLQSMLEENGMLKLVPGVFLKISAIIGEKLLGKAEIFTWQLEDFPYHENRVVCDDTTTSGIKIHYTVFPELKKRAALVRSQIRKIFKPHRMIFIDRGVRLNLGHPSGTCRMGLSPDSSVTDKHCKVHGLENLYVNDASIFPSCSGVNPSLTVAANGLRIGKHIAQQLRQVDPIKQAAKSSLPDSGHVANTVEQNSVVVKKSPDSIKDLVVVIAGADGGLGRAMAQVFIEKGAKVIGVGRRNDQLQYPCSDLNTEQFDFRVIELTNDSVVSDFFADIFKEYGKIDVLLNFATVHPLMVLESSSIDEWWHTIDINVKAAAIFSKSVLPYMKAAGYGRIINEGSNADKNPLPGSSAYAVSKSAIHTFTKVLSREIDKTAYPNIVVSEFRPGPINTQSEAAVRENLSAYFAALEGVILAKTGRGYDGAVITKEGRAIREQMPVSFKQRFKRILKRV